MAESPTITELKRHLFATYGGFADKRFKDLEKSDLFVVDDRAPKSDRRFRRDHDARGLLFPWFCEIRARILDGPRMTISLSGGVPVSLGIRNWAGEIGADLHEGELSKSLSFTMSLGQEARIQKLADLMDAIVGPGAPRYDTPSYKYVCPRTAQSLRRLADVLSSYRGA